jgi:hypothetical protein
MKNLCLILLPTFFLCYSAPAQVELESELEERLSEFIEHLEERKYSLEEMEEELEEVKSEGDDFGQAMMEAEIEGLADWIEQNTESLEELSQIIESQDLEGEEKESSFDAGIERHHRRNQVLDLEFESHRLEVELQLHEEEGDEETADYLEARLDRLSERIERTNEIHAKWEQVSVVRRAGEDERAEELGKALWIEESEFRLQIELAARQREVSEHRRHSEELAREVEKVGKILALSSKMQKQTELRFSEWEKLKENLNDSEGEAVHERMEAYHLSEEKFHLQNEITNLRKELIVAESEDQEVEMDKLNSVISELEQEILEIDGEIER